MRPNCKPISTRVPAVLTALAALALLLSPTAQATNLVLNGGFEAGDFSNWTRSGDTSFVNVGLGWQHGGSYAAWFGSLHGMGYISQALPTTPGQTYELSFWLQNEGGSTNEWQVSWGGNEVIHQSNVSPFDYTLYSFDLLATAASTQLTFGFYNPPSFFDLDDISVTSSGAVPEPAEFMLLGSGLLLLGVLRRLRR